MARRLSIPEDILSVPKGPPLTLELACSCGGLSTHEFEYALVNPDRQQHEAQGWDGVFLPRIVECDRCGAVDDYKLTSTSFLRLLLEVGADAVTGKFVKKVREGSRVLIGVSQLWDGTIAQRPSQAIAHLRKIADERPTSGEALRRLGNAEERFGRLEEAEQSWRRALEVDPLEVESAYSLAKCCSQTGRWQEAFGFLRTGLQLLPKTKAVGADVRRALSEGFTNLLWEVLDETDQPIALEAGWEGESSKERLVVSVSSVDLRKLQDWDQLPEFLVSPELISVDLTADLPQPEDEPTLLERRLSDAWTEYPDFVLRLPQAPFVNAAPRVGRNAPCPCGSGKKFKKCCGG